MRRGTSILISLLLAAAASGQTPANEARKLRTCVSELESLPTPHITADCLLGIGDAFYVKFSYEITRPSVIGPDEKIDIPLIGKVQAANMTVSQLTANLTVLLSEYINHPRVTVTLVDNVTQMRYFVDDDVLEPGRYLLVAPITVLEAIEKAEGFKPGANLKIVVRRQGGAELRLDYKDLLKYPEQNINVQNGDHVVVSRLR